MDKTAILNAVMAGVDEMNELLSADKKIEKSLDTGLYGDAGILDSLQLVRLIVTIEQQLESELGLSLTLANEKAFSLKSSPFRTIGTLVDFIAALAGAPSNA